MSTCTKILLEGTFPISSKMIGSAVMQSPHQSAKVLLVLEIQIIIIGSTNLVQSNFPAEK